MKKNVFFVILLLAFCINVFAKEAVSLDSAISIASAEIMKNPKMGKWKKIVLMNFSDSIDVQNYIEEELANKLINGFTIIIDRRNLGILRDELEFQKAGKVDPDSVKKIGSIYGADFVLWGSFKDGVLTIEATKVGIGEISYSRKLNIKKDVPIKGNIPLNAAVGTAVEHLTQKILGSKKNKVLVYDILADKRELSEAVHKEISGILANNANIVLLKDRDLYGAHAVIYGNIRPVGNSYRLFLYAVDIETAKIIATHSQIVKGDKKEIQSFVLPGQVSNIKVEPLYSDKIRILWDKVSNARNFVVYRTKEGAASGNPIYTGATGIIDFNLDSETIYCYSVQARNSVGVGENSVHGCAQTYGAPEFSSEIKHKKTANNVILTWNKIPGAAHYIVNGKAVYDTVYKEDNLKSSTYYRYVIHAKNSAGSDSGDVAFFTNPVPPKNIKVTDVLASSVTLKWEDAQEHISYYIVDIIDGYPTKTDKKEVKIPNLHPGKNYEFRVKAVNKEDEVSEFSESVKFATVSK